MDRVLTIISPYSVDHPASPPSDAPPQPETAEPVPIPSANGIASSQSTFTSSATPTSQAQPNGQASTVSSATGAAGALAGWAFGSLGKVRHDFSE